MKHPFYKRQKGFTLLELLVVITLLAVLSVGALVAYEGVGDNAQATAAANNTTTSDRMIRNYRAVTGSYPNQWDNLSDSTGGAIVTLADVTQETFGEWVVTGAAANATYTAVVEALEEVGIDELQTIPNASNNATALADISPNVSHNESSGSGADELELETLAYAGGTLTDVAVSVFPSGGAAGICTAGGIDVSSTYSTTDTDPATSAALNKINDSLEADTCHLVLALGFGHDVPGTTQNSSVAFSAAPTFSSKAINPATNYARYVALFHVGSGTSSAVVAADIRPTARLLAVIGPDGKTLDDTLASASAAN